LEDIESRIRRYDNVGVGTSGHINSKDNDHHNDDVRTSGIVSSRLHTMKVRRPRQTTLSSSGFFNMAPSVGIVNTPPHPKIHTNILANDIAKVNLVTLWCEWFKNKLYNSTFDNVTCTQFNYTTIHDLKLSRKSEETKQRRANTLSNIRLQIVAMGDRRRKK
jgi:hypothetical protein